ncbi:TPA: hypothetical protein ACKWS1_004481 [Yersinia enterocolitica]
METRIKHPTIKDAVYIAESVILRLEHSAGRRCGLHDTLYDQFLSEEIHEFANSLNNDERDKFIEIASALHPHLKEYDSYKTNTILNKIRKEEM